MRRKKSTTESSNSLIKELSSVEFIKQPYLYAMVGADFSLYQRSIMIEIMKSMQDRFNEFLKNRRADGQMSLFLMIWTIIRFSHSESALPLLE